MRPIVTRLIVLSTIVILSSSTIVHAAGPFSFHSVPPCRIIDTRDTGSGGAIAHGEVRNFKTAGVCGIPATAAAVAFNFVALGPPVGGHIVAFAYNTPIPPTSTMNFVANEPAIANGSIVGVTNHPTFNLSVMAAGGGPMNLVIDVTGYFQ